MVVHLHVGIKEIESGKQAYYQKYNQRIRHCKKKAGDNVGFRSGRALRVAAQILRRILRNK